MVWGKYHHMRGKRDKIKEQVQRQDKKEESEKQNSYTGGLKRETIAKLLRGIAIDKNQNNKKKIIDKMVKIELKIKKKL